jgi:Family of unknown function (DUF5677)
MILNDRTVRTEIGKRASESLRTIVDYASSLLEMILRTSEPSAFKTATCLLFREAMQKVEVLATLFEMSQCDGGQALLRPLIEAFIYLRFIMIQKNVIGHRELKSWAIIYAGKQKRLAELRIHIAGTAQYREAKALAKQEHSAALYILNEPRVMKQVELLEKELKQPHFEQFTSAWNEYKSKYGGLPPWYVLVGEKPGLDALAKKVRLNLMYKSDYRHYRDHSHGTASFVEIEDELSVMPDPKLFPIRSGRFCIETFATVQSKALELCKAMTIAHYNNVDLFNTWFRAERKSGRLLTKGFMTDPEDHQSE